VKFDKLIIIGPSMEQRISKMAYTLSKHVDVVEVWAEEKAVAKEFEQYIKDVYFVEIPVHPKLKRLPIGFNRSRFLNDLLIEAARKSRNLLIIARDVTYGYIVGKIIKKLKLKNIFYIVDVADNYDLLYDAVNKKSFKIATKIGYAYVTKKALMYSDGIFIVSPVNKPRLYKRYNEVLQDKKIWLLRNLPLEFKFLSQTNKQKNTMVYVGKIDELSRDPFYILSQLKELNEYSIHFYSAQKESTLKKIRDFSVASGISARVIIHERVPYNMLHLEISKYEIGILPHKRNLLTDYTVPNKIYDYKSAGLVTVMSDNPALIEENKSFNFGLEYSIEKNNFAEILKQAHDYPLSDDNLIPTWEESLLEIFEEIESIV
jgi:hypothetical protein